MVGSPLRDYSRDPSIKALKWRGFSLLQVYISDSERGRIQFRRLTSPLSKRVRGFACASGNVAPAA